jgi:hypothetical protein
VNPIFAAALEVQEFCRARGFRFCFIRGLALQRWDEPRLTQDLDLTLISRFGREPECADESLSAFAPRIPDARELARKTSRRGHDFVGSSSSRRPEWHRNPSA